MSRDEVVRRIISCLSDDLLKSRWKGRSNPLYGHCYVVSEALMHLLGKEEWVPARARRKSGTHWWLENKTTSEILDATAGQFAKPYPYHRGVRTGFLTKEPSKRARILMNRAFPHGIDRDDLAAAPRCGAPTRLAA